MKSISQILHITPGLNLNDPLKGNYDILNCHIILYNYYTILCIKHYIQTYSCLFIVEYRICIINS